MCLRLFKIFFSLLGFLDRIEPRPHNALNWAKYEAEAFSRYFYGKKLLPEFEKYDIPEGFKN
jgi:hypothetical protein